VSNTAYGTVGRRVDHGVAALPNNGEESSHARMEKGIEARRDLYPFVKL